MKKQLKLNLLAQVKDGNTKIKAEFTELLAKINTDSGLVLGEFYSVSFNEDCNGKPMPLEVLDPGFVWVCFAGSWIKVPVAQ